MSIHVAANELSALLWRERELLGLLTFKLQEEQLLLTSGNMQWLHHATREVEQVVDRLRSATLPREMAIAAVAAEWGGPPHPTLRELVALAPTGAWTEILQGHLTDLVALTSRIKELRDVNEQYLRTAHRSTQETLASAEQEGATYDSLGISTTITHSALLDQQL